MEMIEKLAILSDAAKYDASCASSGAQGRSSKGKEGIGSTSGMGICHSYTPDGRCISLLKILMTNFCIYDCLYCVNRHSSNVPRARFSVQEVVGLCLEFYKRNYIEGLFLSSGIVQNPDYTMEQLVLVAKSLRENHDFQGYIHLKTIPDADDRLLAMAGRYADRLSINIELPSIKTLQHLAPEKNHQAIGRSMGVLSENIAAAKESQMEARKVKKIHLAHSSGSNIIASSNSAASLSTSNSVAIDPKQPVSKAKSNIVKPKPQIIKAKPIRYAPGGQSTQMIVGADDSSDQKILKTSERLYNGFGLRRVYYSAFSPIPDASKDLPLIAPPLLREHRLYQADWLLRFYGFGVGELLNEDSNQMLDLKLDPKLSWALNHRDFFPIDINRASKEALLRIPGIGPRNVRRIVYSRRFHKLGLADLKRMRIALDKIKPFVMTVDHHPNITLLDSEHLRMRFEEPANQQMALF